MAKYKQFLLKHLFLLVIIFPYITISQKLVSNEIITAKSLKSIDSVVALQMEKYRIPGAVITLVQDDKIVFSKEYGYANIEENKLVDSSTNFRIASLTKTFTAMAALQLVERGKLDLFEDINTYLPDENFNFINAKPFNLHQLLTHTAGFDYTDIGDAAKTIEDIIPLEDIVRYHMPKQVHRPGIVYSYSNYGYTLIGYLIEQVSGQSFAEYMRKNIFQKIGMHNTSLKQPLPKTLRNNLAKGYVWDIGFEELLRDYTNTLPAGGIVSTGEDMGKYMNMLLNDGQFDSITILNQDTFKLLSSQQYGSKHTTYGICYSFFEESWLGHRALTHTGGQLGFLSQIVLIPEEKTGIFISHNSRDNAEDFRGVVAEYVLETTLGKNEKPRKSVNLLANSKTDMSQFNGLYKQVNHPVSTFEKTALLMGRYDSEVKVAAKDNKLVINGSDFIEIEKDVFQIVDSVRTSTIEFIKDDNGKVERLLYGKETFTKIPFYKQSSVTRTAMLIALLILILQFLTKPIRWLASKIRKRNREKQENILSSWVQPWLYWTGFLYVVAVLVLLFHINVYQDQLSDYGVPFSLNVAFVLNIVAAISSLMFPVVFFKIWKSNEMKVGSKLGKSVITLAILITGILFWKHKLIGLYY